MCNTENRKQKLPVGIENFKEIRTEGFYYVDKTTMIRDLLLRWAKVNLFTRPRRFGKSLNMSMLQTFFEIGCDSSLFDGLEILKETELCQKFMGKFPVISISLKNVWADDYETARIQMSRTIQREMRRLQFLLDSNRLSSKDKDLFSMLLNGTVEEPFLYNSLYELTELLEKHYEQKVILLIDEYDVPLAKANEKGYYEPMVSLIRGIFEQVLKTNDHLYFAVLTGCLRVAKESIFTGLNNLKIFSITNVRFHEYFGFTNHEVKTILKYYGLEERYDAMKEWYDGYSFGNMDVYCPWDVINYCDDLIDDPAMEPKDYWSNTSSNEIVRHFIQQMDKGPTKSEIEGLISGQTIRKEIHENLTYNNLYDPLEHIWSVLFITGYLTQRGKPDGKYIPLSIPNMEIRNIFIEQIMAMFKEETQKDGELLEAFCNALETGKSKEAERLFNTYLSKTISLRDTFVRKSSKENFYHGILIGILGYKSGWYLKSNKESGDGYSDILIQIPGKNIGIIVEVKYAEQAAYPSACMEALKQIETENYAKELKEDGFHTILKYGIACYKKKCKVMLEKEM